MGLLDNPDTVLDTTLSVHRGNISLHYGRRVDTSKPIRCRKTRSQNSEGRKIPSTQTAGRGNVPLLSFDHTTVPEGGKVNRNLQHYRIVFKGIAKSLYELNSFRDVFTALLGAIYGASFLCLQLMCCSLIYGYLSAAISCTLQICAPGCQQREYPPLQRSRYPHRS